MGEKATSGSSNSREITEEDENPATASPVDGTQQQQRKSEILHKQRQKNWDYFEIYHPKARSDKKLQQLESKYLRRRTESSLNSGATASIKEENEDASNSGVPSSGNKPMLSDRSKSVPVSLGHSDRNSIIDIEMEVEEDGVKMRRISTDSGEESADSSRRSSRSSVHRRRSSHLSEFINDQKHKSEDITDGTNIEELETASNAGSDSTNNSAEKKRRRLSVEIPNGSTNNMASMNSVNAGGKTEDDGFISLPHTPTDLGLNLDLKIAPGSSAASSMAGSTNSASTSHLADYGIFTSSEETLTNVMTNATSLDICDIATNSSSESSRPSSSAANVTSSVTSSVAENSAKSEGDSDQTQTRRQSVSPMIRPSSS